MSVGVGVSVAGLTVVAVAGGVSVSVGSVVAVSAGSGVEGLGAGLERGS